MKVIDRTRVYGFSIDNLPLPLCNVCNYAINSHKPMHTLCTLILYL